MGVSTPGGFRGTNRWGARWFSESFWCDPWHWRLKPMSNVSNFLSCCPLKFPEVISLNVGGTFFTTRLSTLRRYEDTMLAAMFSGRHYIPRDADGRYFIDRDGAYFGWVGLCDTCSVTQQEISLSSSCWWSHADNGRVGYIGLLPLLSSDSESASTESTKALSCRVILYCGGVKRASGKESYEPSQWKLTEKIMS